MIVELFGKNKKIKSGKKRKRIKGKKNRNIAFKMLDKLWQQNLRNTEQEIIERITLYDHESYQVAQEEPNKNGSENNF